MKIVIDNKEVWKIVRGLMVVANQYNQDRAAKAKEILNSISKTHISINLRCIDGHKPIKHPYDQDLGLYLLKLCDNVAQYIQQMIDQRENEYNIRFYSEYSLKQNNQLVSRSINETIRRIDASYAERRYLISKFPNTHDAIDIQA